MDYPVTPSTYKRFLYIPEPIVIALLRKLLRNPRMEVAMVRHAEAIRDEITQLNDEFMRLIDQSGVFTPTIRFLINQYKNRAPALPAGSRDIRLHWEGILIPVLLLICLILLLVYFI